MVELNKTFEVKGYNSFHSGIIFVPNKYIGLKAKVIIVYPSENEVSD